MASKPKTKKDVTPLVDKVVPACDFDIMTGEPIDRNPHKREMEGTPVLDGPVTVEDVLWNEYGDVMREPSLLGVQMAILKELIRMRGCK